MDDDPDAVSTKWPTDCFKAWGSKSALRKQIEGQGNVDDAPVLINAIRHDQRLERGNS
jgi:hypothetical protein